MSKVAVSVGKTPGSTCWHKNFHVGATCYIWGIHLVNRLAFYVSTDHVPIRRGFRYRSWVLRYFFDDNGGGRGLTRRVLGQFQQPPPPPPLRQYMLASSRLALLVWRCKWGSGVYPVSLKTLAGALWLFPTGLHIAPSLDVNRYIGAI